MRESFPQTRPATQASSSANRFFGRMQFVAVGISFAAIVMNHLHSGNADGHFAQTLAPRTTEAVGNDHGNVSPVRFFSLR